MSCQAREWREDTEGLVGIVSGQHGRYSSGQSSWAGISVPGSLSRSSMIYLRAPGPASCSRARVGGITILTKEKKEN